MIFIFNVECSTLERCSKYNKYLLYYNRCGYTCFELKFLDKIDSKNSSNAQCTEINSTCLNRCKVAFLKIF